MSTPRVSTTSTSVSQRNLASAIVSSIASTLPPKPPTLVEDIHEDEDENGGGDVGGDIGVGGGEKGGVGRDKIEILAKGKAERWRHFARVEIKGKVMAMCYYCKKIIVAHFGNGTKALNEHFKRGNRRKVVDSSQKVLTLCNCDF